MKRFAGSILGIFCIALSLQLLFPLAQRSQAQAALPTTIQITLYMLDGDGAIALPIRLCSATDVTVRGAFGCTVKTDAPFPYPANPITISIEGDYLPDVVGKETNPEQGFTNAVALRAQAIAARSYAYWHIAQGNDIDNSINKQVFIPYQFDRLGYEASIPSSTINGSPIPPIATTENACTAITTPERYKREQSLICAALANPQYVTLSSDNAATQTEFSADWPDGVIPVDLSTPKIDPISGLKTEPCGVVGEQYEGNPPKSHGRGMTQLGANRWARGNRCGTDSLGFVPWSAQFTNASQILTHYYPGIHIRNVGNQVPITPDNRWVPLKFDWGGGAVKPPVFVAGTTYFNLSVTIQNTGINPWTCVGSTQYQVGYRWIRDTQTPWLDRLTDTKPGATRINVCNVGVGESVTKTFTINDVPPWASSTGISLRFDIYQRNTTTNTDITSFRLGNRGGWPEYIQPVRICSGSTCPRHSAMRDIVFVVDGTGIAFLPVYEFKNAAPAIVDSVINSGDDYRFAIVQYENDPIPGLTPTELPSRIVLNFTADRTQILNGIYSIGVPFFDGGPYPARHTVFSGITTATSLPWRATADKTILLYGNTPPHDPELNPQGNVRHTYNSVLAATRGASNPNAAAWSSPIHIDAVAIDSPGSSLNPQTQAVFQALSDETMGEFRHAPNQVDAANDILNALNETVRSPLADAGGPYTTALGSAITLRAPRSFDPDGLIMRYEWDLNNDGVFEETTASPELTYTYAQAYTGPIAVRITDDAGNVTSDTTNVRVEVGMEPVSFATPTNIALPSPRSMAYGDFNNDGKIDVVTAQNMLPTLHVALGNGLGAFGNPTEILLTSNPFQIELIDRIAIGDINNDTKLDIYAWGTRVLGNGDGTFQSPVAVGTGGQAILDYLNGDARLDLVELFGNQLYIRMGQGNGSFQAAMTYATGNQPSDLAVADVNRDGWNDVLVTNTGDNTLSVYLNNGTGGLLPRNNYTVNASPIELNVADVNNDQISDVTLMHAASQTISILLGNSAGAFQAGTGINVSATPQALQFAQLDSDSFADLIVSTSSHVRVYLGNGNGTFQAARSYPNSTSGLGYLGIADVNRDGRLDITQQHASGLSLFLSTITISSNPPTPTPTATPIPTNTPTPTPIPGGSTTLISDSFGRTISNGWGSATTIGGQ
jgi:hypothetical protein